MPKRYENKTKQRIFRQITTINYQKMDNIIKGEDSNIDELVEQIRYLNLDNLVNVKAGIKEEFPKKSKY